MPEWTIGDVVDAIAEAAPDREMTACGARRTTFAQGADGTLRLHGRDSLVVNTGGEKVSVEEIEEALARFKTPKDVMFVDEVRRLGNGKADYWWTKARAAQRVEMA